MAQPGTTAGHRGSRAAGIFQGAADEVDAAANQLQDPENAMTAIDAMEEAGNFLDSVADAFDRIGTGIVDTVYFAPEVSSYLEDLGKYVRQAADPTKEGAAAVRQRHRDRLDEIEENDPKKRKWDQSAHD